MTEINDVSSLFWSGSGIKEKGGWDPGICLLGILIVENYCFSRFLEFPHFHDFQILSNLGRSKSVLGSFFRVLDEKMTQNYASRVPNMYFLNLTFPWPSDLEWPWLEYTHQKLWFILRSVPDTILVTGDHCRIGQSLVICYVGVLSIRKTQLCTYI